MRRITIAVMATITGLVLLFSYRTSTNRQAVTAGPTDPGVAGSTTTGTGAASTTTPTTSPSPSPSANPNSPMGHSADAASTPWGPVHVHITGTDGNEVGPVARTPTLWGH
jgi:hypothetical protein